jgi:hypothetical protein
LKLIESASLVIKSPAGPAFGRSKIRESDIVENKN